MTANATTKSMTMVFIGRSLAGFIGSALFAFSLSRLNRTLVLAAAYITMAAVMTSLPWLGHVIAMTVVYGIGGVAYTIADVGKLHTRSCIYNVYGMIRWYWYIRMMTSLNRKHFPRNWSFARGIHRSPVNSPHKGQWRRAMMFSLICAWTKVQ